MANDKKHILILPKWYPNPSDLQLGIFVRNQAQLLVSEYQTTVLYVKGITNCPEPYVSEIVNTNDVQEIRIYYKQSKGLAKYLNIIKFRKAQNIGLKLIHHPIHLVHVHVPIRPSFLAKKLLKHNAIPYIVTEHWSGHLNGQFTRKSFLYKYFYKKVLNNASQVTAVSKPLEKQLSKIYDKSIQIVPNFINSSSKPLEKKDSNTIQIISVSDFNNKTKNITGLLESFRSAKNEIPSLQLTIIGDGPDKELISQQIKKKSLESHVKLLGRKEQNEVLDLLPAYHFYICNSNVETFGMTVAEAILAGLPVICTQCGGPEQFVNKENGILVPIQDILALKKAILQMAENYLNYNSSFNKQVIKNKFGKDAVLQKWKNVYDSILNE